jgi:hypothetical protein
MEQAGDAQPAEVTPWADASSSHTLDMPAYTAPAEPVWNPSFEPGPGAATPAEDALAAEMEPADGFPAVAEAALAYEAAGVSAEVPTSGAFGDAARIADAAEPEPLSFAASPAPAAEYGEVADRLETIARALRDDPASFLAGGSGDALGLLVTGFVLGYGHGRRQHAS